MHKITGRFLTGQKGSPQKRQQSGLPTSDNLIVSYNDKADKIEEKHFMVKGSKIVLNITIQFNLIN